MPSWRGNKTCLTSKLGTRPQHPDRARSFTTLWSRLQNATLPKQLVTKIGTTFAQCPVTPEDDGSTPTGKNELSRRALSKSTWSVYNSLWSTMTKMCAPKSARPLTSLKPLTTRYAKMKRQTHQSAPRLSDLRRTLPLSLPGFLCGYYQIGLDPNRGDGKLRADHSRLRDHGNTTWNSTPKTLHP